MINKISIIGGAGHVGLPFSLVLSKVKGFEIIAIDNDGEKIAKLNRGEYLYKENDIGSFKDYPVKFTTQYDDLDDSNVIVVMIGTPVDEEGNARVDDIFNLFDVQIIPRLTNKKQLIILRSTVSPGTTDVLKKRIEAKTNLIESRDFYLVFAPERVSQGNSLKETKELPQLIGAYSETSHNITRNFFDTFNTMKGWYKLTPKEAEFGKLVTNMYRYVTFALANEFYMIGSELDIDTHKVIEAVNADYPRMNLPKPGVNVGGPCLFKDGKFLLDSVPYADLINVSFHINEGMPNYVASQIDFDTLNNVLICGMTFKAESDDTRNSLSFKMKKILEAKGIDVVCYDPYWENSEEFPINFSLFDAVIIMTPHKIFKTLFENNQILNKLPSYCWIADPWKLLDKSKEFNSGIYLKLQKDEYV